MYLQGIPNNRYNNAFKNEYNNPFTTTNTVTAKSSNFYSKPSLCTYRAFPIMNITMHLAGPGAQGTFTFARVFLSLIFQLSYFSIICITVNTNDSRALRTEKRHVFFKSIYCITKHKKYLTLTGQPFI